MTRVFPAAILAAACALPLAAQADPAAYVGLSYTFGGNFGITAKVLHNDEEQKAVAAIGASYYFGAAEPFGIDLSAGYAFDNAAALVGYDFLQKSPFVSAGWADLEDDSTPPPPPPPAE